MFGFGDGGDRTLTPVVEPTSTGESRVANRPAPSRGTGQRATSAQRTTVGRPASAAPASAQRFGLPIAPPDLGHILDDRGAAALSAVRDRLGSPTIPGVVDEIARRAPGPATAARGVVSDASRALDAVRGSDASRVLDAVRGSDASRVLDAVRGSDASRALDAVRESGAAQSISDAVGGSDIARATSEAVTGTAESLSDTVARHAAPVMGAARAVGAGSPASAEDLEELARQLYEPLSARLRTELWLDRERSGLLTDR